MKNLLPTSVPGAILAQLFSLTQRRIRALADEGVVVRSTKRGWFELVPSIHGYLSLMRNATENATLTNERRRWLAAKADQAEHDLARSKGAVAHTVQRQVETILIVCRTELLHLGARLAPRLAQEQTPRGCATLVDTAIREGLTRMVDNAEGGVDEVTGMPLAYLQQHDDETEISAGNGKQ